MGRSPGLALLVSLGGTRGPTRVNSVFSRSLSAKLNSVSEPIVQLIEGVKNILNYNKMTKNLFINSPFWAPY